MSRLSLSLSPGQGSTLYPNFLRVPTLGLGPCEDPVIGLDPSSSSDENGSCLFFIAVRVFKELFLDNAEAFFSFTLAK